jgi:uncharacterized protein with von Willebrand factor type A (vWA) domain
MAKEHALPSIQQEQMPMPFAQLRAFVWRDSGRCIARLALRKLRRQSLGAVQQHRRSTASCRSGLRIFAKCYLKLTLLFIPFTS